MPWGALSGKASLLVGALALASFLSTPAFAQDEGDWLFPQFSTRMRYWNATIRGDTAVDGNGITGTTVDFIDLLDVESQEPAPALDLMFGLSKKDDISLNYFFASTRGKNELANDEGGLVDIGPNSPGNQPGFFFNGQRFTSANEAAFVLADGPSPEDDDDLDAETPGVQAGFPDQVETHLSYHNIALRYNRSLVHVKKKDLYQLEMKAGAGLNVLLFSETVETRNEGISTITAVKGNDKKENQRFSKVLPSLAGALQGKLFRGITPGDHLIYTEVAGDLGLWSESLAWDLLFEVGVNLPKGFQTGFGYQMNRLDIDEDDAELDSKTTGFYFSFRWKY